jgi:hypothetical protein
VSELERRYRRLLFAYPARYRAERGEEIVGTYLETAGPHRRWPSPADIRDALGGGLRQHLRATGLTGGLPVAAMLATGAAVTLAAIWLLLVEIRATSADFVIVRFGPFQSLGAVVWMGWLIAGAATLTLPGRVARAFVLAALTGTLAVVPAAALTPYDRPPLLVLVPQAVLGIAALGLPNRSHRGARLGVTLTVVAAATVAAATGQQVSAYGYRWLDSQILAAGAVTLLTAGLTVAAVQRNLRGVSAGLILLPAVALLLVEPAAHAIASTSGPPMTVDWTYLAAVAATTTVLACAALALTAALHGRRVHRQPTHCPTCGRS